LQKRDGADNCLQDIAWGGGNVGLGKASTLFDTVLHILRGILPTSLCIEKGDDKLMVLIFFSGYGGGEGAE